MRSEYHVKEKVFYYPASFEELDTLVKDGFVINKDRSSHINDVIGSEISTQGITFFADSAIGNESIKGPD